MGETRHFIPLAAKAGLALHCPRWWVCQESPQEIVGPAPATSWLPTDRWAQPACPERMWEVGAGAPGLRWSSVSGLGGTPSAPL